MSAHWDRLETTIRAIGLTEGVQAPIADPLWMLARQWQVGEFTGDDAAQPAAVRVVSRTARITSYRPGAGAPIPFPAQQPLERVVEQSPASDLGSAGLFDTARASRRLLRALRQQGLDGAFELLRAAYPVSTPPPADTGRSGRAAAALLHRCALDAPGLAAAAPADSAARAGIDPGQRAGPTAVLTAWRGWYAASHRGDDPTWDEHRMEYSFSLAASSQAGEVTVRAAEHDGGDLDWHTVDLTRRPADGHGLPAETLPSRSTVTIPTPIRYPGMPASRWWELEDATVHFGDIEAGPADLARLLVAEFATAYADDHFVVPIRVPVGSLTEIESVDVFDTFGGRTPVPSAAKSDFDRVGPDRVWRLFELTGDEVDDAHVSPWLFVPPSAPSLSGPALERVTFTRDESANLAWGIEQLIEGPLGRGVRRADTWTRSAVDQAPDGERDPDLWRYRLADSAPPWWIPLLAERFEPGSAQVRLRRGRMQAWQRLPGDQAGPRGALLDPRRACWLYEEEVPTGGVRVERAWQLARWVDGSVHPWLRRRKRPGRGDPASGIGWDLIDRG